MPMQTIAIEPDHDNLFCPATGVRVSCSEEIVASPATLAHWHGELADEPSLYREDIERAWDHYLAALDEDDSTCISDFLETLDDPNFICFQIERCGFSCGPVSTTEWFLFDMNYDVRQQDDAHQDKVATD
jgi:hypothetical protein